MRVVVVQPDPERIAVAVTPRTRLLAVSPVLWTTRQMLPVHQLKAETGLPILVDGAQSVGTIPVDASRLDFYTVSGQKWRCGPEGTGALVVADPESLRVARPSYFAQQSYEPDGRYEPKAGARRSHPNLSPSAHVAGLRAPSAARPEWGYDRAAEMAERFRGVLREAGADVVAPLLLRPRRKGFAIFQGNQVYAGVSLLAGADGLVPGHENIWPDLLVGMYDAALRKEMDPVWQAQAHLNDLMALRARAPIYTFKAVAQALGLMGDTVAAPLPRLSAEEARQCVAADAAIGLPLDRKP